MDTITIRKPDDWHCHLRDGAMLAAVLPFTARRFARAIVMPNLSPNLVKTTAELLAYRERIIAAAAAFPSFTPPTTDFAVLSNGPSLSGTGENSEQSLFSPLMTYYLTDDSSPEEIARGFTDGIAAAVKLYPANATTNSAAGVTDIAKVYPVFEAMQKVGMPLLLHGETVLQNGVEVSPEDREKVFLDTTLPKLLEDLPALKVVLEHATTRDAVDFVRHEASSRLASTTTAHHLIATRDDAAHAKKPAYFHCMPVIKSKEDRAALRRAACSGDPRFFLGTDSAPHPTSAKEREKPAAGIFTAPAALELYAQVFEEEGKLENFEAFASLNGPRFYGLPPNEEKITLERKPWTIDALVEVSNESAIRPFGYDDDPAQRLTINWRVTD